MPFALDHPSPDENHAVSGQARMPTARLTRTWGKPCKDMGLFVV
jgi:hypothetical protein